MLSVCLCVLCGLPGAGKTTLCNHLLNSKSSFNYIHISYDHLIPWIDFSAPDVLDSWKKYRNEVLELVKFLINVILVKSESSSESVIENLKLLKNETVMLLYNVALKFASEQMQNIVLLIDDNMPYRRMRYEYFQIARLHNIGYCTAMVDCSINECQERNKRRPIQEIVQQKSLKRINAQMERPDIIKESWETYYCVIKSESGSFENVLDEIFQLFNCASQDPVVALPVQDQKAIEEIKLINRKNFTHQADLCLRKLTSEFLKQQKDPKLFANKINFAKKCVLNEIKSGQIDDQNYVDNSGNINQEALKLKVETLLSSFIDELS